MSDPSVIRSMKAAFSMTKQRCYNPKCRDYKYYGGRGITICDRWLESFDNLIADMGVRPDGQTLERKENDGPYSPDNCVWAPRSQQSCNTRLNVIVEYAGRSQTISEWERELGWKSGTLKARLQRLGYTVEEAFTKPVKCGAKLAGRTYKLRRKPDMSRVPRGQAHCNIGLTVSDVVEARAAYALGGHTFSSLSRMYGVSVTTMSNAIQGLGAYKEVK